MWILSPIFHFSWLLNTQYIITNGNLSKKVLLLCSRHGNVPSSPPYSSIVSMYLINNNNNSDERQDGPLHTNRFDIRDCSVHLGIEFNKNRLDRDEMMPRTKQAETIQNNQQQNWIHVRKIIAINMKTMKLFSELMSTWDGFSHVEKIHNKLIAIWCILFVYIYMTFARQASLERANTRMKRRKKTTQT